MKRLSLVLIIALLCMAKATAQITPPDNQEEEAQTQEYEQLILGTWVNDEIPDTKYEFNANGTATVYYGEGTQPDTYNWNMYTDTTPSGILITNLNLVGTFDPDDKLNFTVGLTQNQLNLESSGAGIHRSSYHRQ